MKRYFIVNDCRDLIKEITKEHYDNYKIFNKKIEEYSNVFDCFLNLKRSEAVIDNYLKDISKNKQKTINEIYTDCKFIFLINIMFGRFLINIMFGRILIDNIKAYCKKINRGELIKYIHKVEKKDEIKMLKVLRNFGQHYALPFSDLKIKEDLINDKTTIDFLINLKIIKNSSNLNRADRDYVYKLREKKISISTYYKMWMTCLNEVFIKIRKDFSDRNAKLINSLLLNLFSEYLDIEDENLVQGITEVDGDNINFLMPVDMIPINFTLIKNLIKNE